MKLLINLPAAKWLLPLSLVLFTLISCKKTNDFFGPDEGKQIHGTKYNTFKGPQVEVGNGYARTFITISHTGVPKEIGVVFTDEALSGLNAVNTPYVLELHRKALEVTPFEHVALGWSANGHPLPGSFIGPHFDVRFFMISLAERLAIPAPPSPGFLNLPPAGFMPANYFPDAPAPMIGMHWTDKSFITGVPVNHAMILGTYDGAFTFVSPIATRTELVSGQCISITYAQPQLFAEHSYYPTKYNIYMDEKRMHYITLSDFVWR